MAGMFRMFGMHGDDRRRGADMMPDLLQEMDVDPEDAAGMLLQNIYFPKAEVNPRSCLRFFGANSFSLIFAGRFLPGSTSASKDLLSAAISSIYLICVQFTIWLVICTHLDNFTSFPLSLSFLRSHD
jgi:hypothetical protein